MNNSLNSNVEAEDKTDDPYNKVRIRFVFVIDHSGQKRKQHKNTFECYTNWKMEKQKFWNSCSKRILPSAIFLYLRISKPVQEYSLLLNTS